MNKVKRNERSKKAAIKNNENSEKLKAGVSKTQPTVAWTTENKRTLLKALRQHGHEDINGISKMLPKIPPEEIKSKIQKYSVMSEYLCEDELIDNWLKCGLYKPGDSPLPTALRFIQLFEDHPSVAESGHDFRAIYNFLYHVCLEQPSFPDLPRDSKNLLFDLLSKVEEKHWPKSQTEIWEYLGKVYKKRNISKAYPGKKQSFF